MSTFKTKMDSQNAATKYHWAMDYPQKMEKYIWSTIRLLTAHVFGIRGILMLITGEVPRTLAIFSKFLNTKAKSKIHAQNSKDKKYDLKQVYCSYFVGTGITMGCHRLWAHKTFKAKLPLQILLAYINLLIIFPVLLHSIQSSSGAEIIVRLHHKYVETDADPHDARRGFWFAHMGWLFQKEHKAVKEKEATIDLSDLDNDPVVRFQTK
jgi:fatty-acid desaturase